MDGDVAEFIIYVYIYKEYLLFYSLAQLSDNYNLFVFMLFKFYIYTYISLYFLIKCMFEMSFACNPCSYNKNMDDLYISESTVINM